jgi:hypothetical protein
MIKSRKRREREREELERIAANDTGHIQSRWFHDLPAEDATLVVKENGVVVGTIDANEVHRVAHGDIHQYLWEHDDFGPGRYSIAARYQGAFRGRHMRFEIGEPSQWRRGKTRAQTRAFMEKERERREFHAKFGNHQGITVLKAMADRGLKLSPSGVDRLLTQGGVLDACRADTDEIRQRGREARGRIEEPPTSRESTRRRRRRSRGSAATPGAGERQ